jgi:DNA-binding Lrp family transcriptional regulator
MKKRGKEIRAQLLEIIKADPNTANAQLAKRLGVSESTVRYHLARLRKAGLLEK